MKSEAGFGAPGRSDQKDGDDRLVGGVCSGDRAAFDALYDRYFERVHRWAANGDPSADQVEAAVEEAMMGLFGSLEEVPPDRLPALALVLARRALGRP